MLFQNSKGNIPADTITLVVLLFAFGIISVAAYTFLDDVSTDILADQDMGSEARNITTTVQSNYIPIFDGAILTMLILFAIGLVVSVFLIDTHPIFFILTFVVAIAVLLVALFLANSWDDIMTGSAFSAVANQMTYTRFIMSHLVEIIVGFIFLGGIALFAKIRE